MKKLLHVLSNIALLKHVPIQRLLKIMTACWVMTTLAFGVMGIIFNHFIVNKQEDLIKTAVPVIEVSQRLNKVVSDLIARRSNIESAKNLEELEPYIDNSRVKNEFLTQIEKLNQMIQEEEKHFISDLYASYEDFVHQDGVMINLIHKSLALNAKIQDKMLRLKETVKDVQNAVDGLTGVINLNVSKENRKLRKLLEQGDLNRDETPQVIAQIRQSLISKKRRIGKAGNQIWQGSAGLIIQFFRLVEETNSDALISIRDNEVVQQIEQIESAFNMLKSGTSESESRVLLKKILTLEQAIQQLNLQLITEQDSVYNLKQETLSLRDIIADERSSLLTIVDEIQNGLDTLSVTVSSISNDAFAETKNINEGITEAIIIACVLTLSAALSCLIMLMIRIENPLLQIHKAMSALSSGKLATRLATEGMAKDEFLDLAKDFNSFVDKNQKMIVRLSKAREELLDSERRTSAIVENALVGIAHINNRRFISVNKKFEEMVGFTREELKGQGTSLVYPDNKIYNQIGKESYGQLLKTGHYENEWEIKRKDGHVFLCNLSAKLIDQDDIDKGSIWIYEDISERKNNEDKLRYLANYDTLTKLPNRAYFQSRLEKDIYAAEDSSTELGVLFIDLDRFKQVNDSLGHEAGDMLLQEIARRLKGCVRGSDSVARIGGDEFTVIVTGLTDYDAIELVANKILDALKQPVELAGEKLSVSPSIGVSIYPTHGTSVSALVKNADAAMYHAKAVGRNNFQYYSIEMNSKSHARLAMENKLRDAIEKDEFVLFYQPQVDTFTRNVVGYEALIRWQNEEHGLVSPGDFIPLLEESGLIIPVGEWVLRTACKQLAQWQKNGRENIKVSVNLSAKQFQQQNLVAVVADIIKETGIDPQTLDLEITETILMEGSESSQQMLYDLYNLGVRLSLDDFGTGYSSLAYLKRFPINVIKIDQSFVRGCLEHKSDAAICEAIIDIARRLNLEVVAEGVESEEQLAYLKANQCHTIQGFLFGRPVPVEQINLMKHSSETAIVA